MSNAPSTEAVTLADVRRVAELANLELTPAEEPRMARDLNAILGHIAQLSELDTTGIEPMAQVSDIQVTDIQTTNIQTTTIQAAGDPGEPPSTTGARLRPDTVRPSLDRRAVMAAAPQTDGRFFKVPKVIER